MSFHEITNSAAVMFALALILFLLMYIAFWKKDSPRKSSKSRS